MSVGLWSAADSTKSVVLELQTNGAWQTVVQSAGTSYSAALTEGASVRLFDGVNFLTATVPADPEPEPTESDSPWILDGYYLSDWRLTDWDLNFYV